MIKSKEEIINECIKKHLPSLMVMSEKMHQMIEAAMQTYHDQFTASKEKEYREALQKIKDRADNGEITGTVFELDKDLSEIYTIATEALNK